MTICRFVILGVPVVIHSASCEIIDRAEICYSALPQHDAADQDCVQADVNMSPEGWTVRVSGRSPVVAEGFLAAIRTLNHELLHGLMLRCQNLFYVHAGVVAIDGEALILPGLSRAGKSTLVLALLQQGAEFLSDELLVFDPDNRVLLPFPRAVKVRDECVGYFPDLAQSFVGEGECRFLRSDGLEGLQIASEAKPAHIAAPRWQAGDTNQVESLTRGEGLIHLLGSALNFGSHRSSSIDHLAEMVGSAGCSSVTWSDPHTAARLLLETMGRRQSTLPS